MVDWLIIALIVLVIIIFIIFIILFIKDKYVDTYKRQKEEYMEKLEKHIAIFNQYIDNPEYIPSKQNEEGEENGK